MTDNFLTITCLFKATIWNEMLSSLDKVAAVLSVYTTLYFYQLLSWEMSKLSVKVKRSTIFLRGIQRAHFQVIGIAFVDCHFHWYEAHTSDNRNNTNCSRISLLKLIRTKSYKWKLIIRIPVIFSFKHNKRQKNVVLNYKFVFIFKMYVKLISKPFVYVLIC